MSSKRGLTGVCSNEFQIMSKWGPKEFENRSNWGPNVIQKESKRGPEKCSVCNQSFEPILDYNNCLIFSLVISF